MRSWVRLDPIAGKVDPHDWEDVTVTLDATNLVEGQYEADVHIISNDVENPLITINVKLVVGEGPGINVQPESIEFGDVLVGESSYQTVTISNISTVDLEIERITLDGEGFTHNHQGIDNFTLGAEEIRNLLVTFQPGDAQNYNSTLTIYSNDALQPETAIQLTGQGIIPPPDIYLGYLPEDDPGISFTEHVITTSFDGAEDICKVDVDADGDMDILGAAGIADDIAWWENDGSENFTRQMIFGNFDGAVSISCKDLDRDGDIDILGAAQDADDITWWENDGFQGFTAHIIAGEFDGASSVFTADVDGDGDIDVLGTAFNADDITWWENDGREGFTEHTIQGDFDGASSVSAIDLDGDSDMDILGTATEADDITWWENNGDKSFSVHTIQGDFDGACSVYPIDVDDDGDMDIVGAALNADDITWWENDGNGSFSVHTIDGDFDGASSVYAVDFEGDGDIDIIGAATDANQITWWENDGDENFIRHTIGADFNGAASVKAGDIDSDGDNDVIGVAQEADAVTWWENTHVFGYDFGEIEKDSTITWTFVIFNHGAQILNVTGIQSNNNVYSTDFAGNANIDPGASLEIEVSFTPNDYSVFDGILEVQSNDPDEGALTVSLTGVGIFVNYPPVVENPIPDLELDEDFDPFVIADLDTVFFDVNDDDLIYYAQSDHNEVTVEIVNNSQLRIDSFEDNWYGSIEIAVTADDGWDDGGRSPRNDNGPVRQLRQIKHDKTDSMIALQGTESANMWLGLDKAQKSPIRRGGRWDTEPTNFSSQDFIRRDDTVDMVFTVQVNPVNDPPQWDNIPDSVNVNEVEELSFTVAGSDLDGDDVTFSAVSGDLPDGWEFTDNGDGAGTFNWTPSYDDSGEYTVTFTVSDTEYDADEDVVIIVNHVNRPPVLTAIGDKEVNENENLSFTLEATDPDGDAYTFSTNGLPEGANLEGADFSWTPSYDQSGSYDVTFIVTDNGAGALTDEEAITITVNHVNRNPVLTAIGNKEVNENETLTFTLEATDIDGDGYTFSAAGLPEGASLNGADFSWTPSYDQSGNYDVTFTVTDDGAGALTDEETITITVNHVNRSPVWANLPDSPEGDEAEELSFVVEASDPDGDDLTIDASSDDLPDGWDFTDNGDGTGSFSWTPGYEDTGEYTLTVNVSDAEFAVAEDIVIVVNHVNRTPAWVSVPGSVMVNESSGLSFTVRASDPDNDDLSLSASSGDLPNGWNFTDNGDGTGSFAWTPTFSDAGEYNLTVTVSDGEFAVRADIVITVNDVNRAPVWEYVPDSVTGNENAVLVFSVTCTDPDNDELTITTSSDNLPGGWNFTDNGDGTGRFTWTPGFDDSGEYTLTVTVSDGEYDVDDMVAITINHVNRQPVWVTAPENQTADENQELSFAVEASDPDEDDLTITASSVNLPDGWQFTDNSDGTASFRWTPSYDESGDYSLTIAVSDGRLQLRSTISISVNHVNRAPEWTSVPESVTINENQALEIIVVASDPDADDLRLTASSDDLPGGWQFTDYGNNRGSFRWTPTYNDSGEYNVTFTVSDGEFDIGADVTITVNQVNRSPVWGDIPQSVNTREDELLEFTVRGSDPDGDNLTIEYSSENIPGEAGFTDNEDGTGTFSWRPAYNEAGAYLALFTLSDGNLSVEAEVIITVGEVNRPPNWDNVPETASIEEAAELTVTVEGSDPDDDAVTIAYSSDDIPEAAEFTDNQDGTGVLTWTPTYDNAGEYTATFTISDGEFNVVRTVTIIVNHVNRAPVWENVPETVSVDENSRLEFSVSSSDPDGDNLTLNATSENLPGGWNFTDNGDGTGTFTWTPSYEDEGEYSVILTVSDDEFDITTDVSIIVNHVNRSPVWESVPDQVSVNENQQLQFSVRGSDPDGDEITINASSEDLPEGWSFNDNSDGTGSFRWTPGFEDSGEYIATFTLSDGEFNIEEDVTIQVNHVNRSPEWVYIPETEEVEETDVLEFSVRATDPDGDDLTIQSSSGDLPEGWEFTDNGEGIGSFTWTPGFEDSGEYSLTLTVSDSEFNVVEDVIIIVTHLNRMPSWDNVPGNVETDELELLGFTVVASDPDGDDLTVQASSDDLPDGWEFTDNGNGNGAFSWTPTYDDAGEYTLTVMVSDDEFDVTEDVTFTVIHVNRTPAWVDVPESSEIDENQLLEFTVQASDPDGDNLTFNASSGNLPEGWGFTDNEDGTGTFSWTPSYDDAGEYSLVIDLSDGEFQLQRTVTIVVIDINRAPVWSVIPDVEEVDETAELTFTVEASDPDGDDVIIVATSGDLPDNWEFTDNEDGTGSFTWTPGYNDSGEYTVTFNASDFVLNTVEDVTIRVNQVNRSPVWDNVPESVQTAEMEELTFLVQASDPDGDNLTIEASSDDLPQGWEFTDNGDRTGSFVWTPGYDDAGEYTLVVTASDGNIQIQSSITITVNHVNRTPVWSNVPENVEGDETQELSFTVEAADPDGDDLTLNASSDDIPEGWEFTDNGDNAGTFTWTSGYDDSGQYTATLTASDGEFTIESSVTITINHVNRQPEWINVPDAVQTNENELLQFTVTASDPDGDDLTINASSDDLPDGWGFNDNGDHTGTFSWTPSYDDAGEYTLVLVVSDAEYQVQSIITITVNSTNRRPVWLDMPGSETIDETDELSFNVEAIDPDGDDLRLEASSEDMPEGWEFTDHGDGAGTFNWTPSYDDGGEYTLNVVVSDDEFHIEVYVTITVRSVNRSPVWINVPESAVGYEDESLVINVVSSDPDGDNLILQASSEDLPGGWAFNYTRAGRGTFSWTPTYNDAGEYTLNISVSDGEYLVNVSVSITINDVNRAPTWINLTKNYEVNEAEELNFTARASDPDGDDFTLSASSDNLPEGWEFNDNEDGTGAFNWTPNYDDEGTYTVSLIVSDAEFDVVEEVEIVVGHVNRAPFWSDNPESIALDETEEFSMILEAVDPDGDDLVIEASSDDLPEGWEFTDNRDGTGTFDWTPTYNDAGEYTLTVAVSDAEFETTDNILITVAHVNRAPIWTVVPESREVSEAVMLTVNVTASDPDNDGLELSASSENLPEGWQFVDHADGRGTFTWRPSYDDAGEYTLLVTVSDGEFDVQEDVSITVNHVNRRPVWSNIPQSLSINENELLEFTIEGADPDGDELTISYGSENLPEEVNFTDNNNGAADFSWRPGDDDVGSYTALFTISDNEFDVSGEVVITVGDVNRSPIWDEIPENVEVNEAEELSFNVVGSDPDDDQLTIQVTSEDLPDGWEFVDHEDGSGTFTWSPNYDHSGQYIASFTLSDGEFNRTRYVGITVNHVNRTPEWDDVPESMEVNENQLLEFTVRGSDPDNDSLIITYSSENIPGSSDFTDNDDGTGRFSWRPTYDSAGEYNAVFTISDGGFSVQEDVVITVIDVNRQPIWRSRPVNVAVNEEQLLEFTVQASDPDGGDITINASSDDLPEGWNFTDNSDGTADFGWTPSFDDAGEYSLLLTVSDGVAQLQSTVAITVNQVNRQPAWIDLIKSQKVDEAGELSFTVEGSDPDEDDLTLSAFSDDLPEGWEFTDNGEGTAGFVWTPTYDDGGDYILEVTVSDDEYEITEEITITVNHINRIPIWADIPDSVDINENELLAFTVDASDPDDDELTISCISDNLPDGWQFRDHGNGSGTFRWTPTYNDAGEYIAVFAVSDGDLEIDKDVTINVNPVNRQPVWEAILDSVTVYEARELSFTIEASDPDGDDLTLTASSDDLPEGWEFTDNGDATGTFVWMPAYDDAGEYSVAFTVSDGELNMNDNIIIVVNDVNRAPIWDILPESVQVNEEEELSFTVEASDPDNDQLTLDASSEDLPDGWEFTDNGDAVGMFVWTPTHDNAGEYTLVLVVSDGERQLQSTVTITVDHVNRAPLWINIPEVVEASETEELSFTVQASDPDSDDLSIAASSDDLPEGWTFIDHGDGRGTFRWTPTYDDSGEYALFLTVSDGERQLQSSITITVNHVNRAPGWIDLPESVEINEDEELILVIETSDPDGDDLTLEAVSDNLPEGWEFTDHTNGRGTFRWTCDYDDAGEYSVNFTVSDDEYNVEATVIITVTDVNRTPVWNEIPQSVSIQENELLEFTVSGSDPDGDELTVNATSGNLPDGWEFTDHSDGSGDFSWRPGQDDSGAFRVLFTLSDAEYNVSAEVIITVGDVNRPPDWIEVPDYVEIDENERLELTVVGSDPDDDQVTIGYLSEDIPEDAEFTDNGNGTAILTWTPTFDEAGEYTAVFTISDEEFDVDAEVTITVINVNRAPVWDDLPEGIEVDEDQLIEFTVRGSDPDGNNPMVIFNSEDIPDNAQFTDNDNGTGTFYWQTTFDDAGEYTAIFTLSDGQLTNRTEVPITINNINRPPVWDDVPEVVEVSEASELSFTVQASDPDGDDLSINATSDNLPDSWEFVDNQNGTGTFGWTPGMTDAGEYSLTVIVSDSEYNLEAVVTITVGDNNRVPYWENIPELVEVTEGGLLQIEVAAIDEDDDDLTLEAASINLPEGWNFRDNFNGTGLFTWQTTLEDEGEYAVVFNVSDGKSDVDAEVSISVNHLNAPPVWDDVPNNVHTDMEQLLEFYAAGSDMDGNDLTIDASSDNLPDGWEFTDNRDGTGEFTWTPGNDDEGAYTITLALSDGIEAIEHEVTITVGNVNRPPDWVDYPVEVETSENELLEFIVEGSDPNDDNLNIEVTASNLPDVYEFTDNGDGTGVFVWTPGFEDAGSYSLTLMLSDGAFENEANISITVLNTNRAPVWTQVLETIEGNENQAIEFTVTASDPDGNNVAFEAESDDLPGRWNFTDNHDGSADFVWTPGFDDAGEYTLIMTVTDGEVVIGAEVIITVLNVNRSPVWNDVPETVSSEQDRLLEFEVTGSDPDGDGISLRYRSDDLPEAVSFRDFGNGTGRFSWEPAFNDLGDYLAVFTISDGESNVDAEVSITVTATNRSPHWDDIPQSIHFNVEEEGRFQIAGSDPDNNELTIEVAFNGLPEGWEFTDNGDGTGVFVWTPQANDEGSYTSLFTISDGILSDEAEVIITVGDVNQPPVWNEVTEAVEVDEANTLEFSVMGSDPDDDAVTIAAASGDLPDGWQFTDNENGTGDFAWTTDYTDEGVYTLYLTISDDEFDVATEIVITVNNTNRDPVWEAPDPNTTIIGQEDQELTFEIQSGDPDGDDLAVTVNDRGGLPEAARFTNNGDGTGTLIWMTGYEDEGMYNPVFVLSDGEASVSVELSINIQNTNRPPVWDEVPERVEIEENQLLEFTVAGSDPDGGELSVIGESEDLPDGWELTDNNDGTGTFSWQPAFDDAGEYLLTAIISDAEHAVESDIVIIVNNVNRAPEIINAFADVEIDEDSGIFEIADLDTVFTDPDGDDLTFEIVSGIDELNLVINEETNVLTLEPGRDYNGESDVVIIADDGSNQVRMSGAVRFNSRDIEAIGGTDIRSLRRAANSASITPPRRDDTVEDAFVVRVISVNDEPFWYEYPEGNMVVCGATNSISFNIMADDVDEGDELSIEMTDPDGLPDAVEFVDNNDGTATFTWQTTIDDVGEYNPTFTVSDAELSAELELSVIVNIERDQEIDFIGGWNLISLNVSPCARFYSEDDERGPSPELMCRSVFYNAGEESWSLIQMKDEHGNFCTPQWDFWGIDYWNPNEGYQIKIEGDREVVWTGTPIDAQADLLDLDAGWNIIAFYPNDYDLPCEYIDADNENNYYVLQGIIDHVIIAKDVNGNYCIPEWDYSDMLDWTAGQGYQICLDADIEVFNYPVELEDQAAMPGHKIKSNGESHWTKPAPTGENMSVLVNSVHGLSIGEGDQIAAFNIDGDLTGTGMFTNGKCGLAVWGDDIGANQTDGMVNGEAFELKLWDADRKLVVDLNAGIVKVGSGLEYKKDGIVVLDVRIAETMPKDFSLVQNYPNPFNPSTNIGFSLPEPANIRLTVSDVSGRQLAVIYSGHMLAGYHTATWNANNLPTGIYIFTLEANGVKLVIKGVLIR
jgi:hypothetical protein